MLAKIHLEVFALSVGDMVKANLIVDGLIELSVALLESCLLLWQAETTSFAAEEYAGHLVELSVLIHLSLPEVCVAGIVRPVVIRKRVFRLHFHGK